MKWIKHNLSVFLEGWNTFWFKPIDAVYMSCFRFCASSVILITYLIRFFDIKLFFYESGLLSSSSAKAISQAVTKSSFRLILSSDAWLYFCYLLFILVLLLMILGVSNRLLAGLAFVLHLIFIHRNPAIVYGVDSIITFWLFYLTLSNSGKDIKWFTYFFNKRRGLVSERNIKGDWLNTVACRLVQIQLCVIYMYSGLEKLKGQTWWEGTAVWETLSFYDLGTSIDFSFLLSVPLVSAFLTAFTVLFEIYFPVLIWIPRMRWALLVFGLLFHLMIGVFIGIYLFSLIMLSAYVLFVSPETLKRTFRFVEK